MGFEASPPNSFRALAVNGQRPALLVTDKRGKGDPAATGLGAVKVRRAEGRSSNQRDNDRHRLTDEQAVVRHKGKRHVVDLINLSHGGAMIGGKFKAKLWDRVGLVLGDGGKNDKSGEIECAVRWIRGGRLGLEFAHETHIDCDPETLDELLLQVIRNSFPDIAFKARPATSDGPAATDQPAQKRSEIRHPLIWNGILRYNSEWEKVRLRNISRLGALVEGPVTLVAGATVKLELSEIGRLAATVSWSRGNQMGLAFDEPFDVRTLSKSTPEIAAQQSLKPRLEGGGQSDPSPWASEWSRLSVDELRENLEGYLKY
jgi:hypothetical protein